MDLHKLSKAVRYVRKFLIWREELRMLRQNAEDQCVNWHVDGRLEKVFTRRSILEAIDNRLGIYNPYNDSYFIEIDYDHLIEHVDGGTSNTINKTAMIAWLESQLTDMKTYDPRGEMEEGEHIFGAVARTRHKEESNKIINSIILELNK